MTLPYAGANRIRFDGYLSALWAPRAGVSVALTGEGRKRFRDLTAEGPETGSLALALALIVDVGGRIP